MPDKDVHEKDTKPSKKRSLAGGSSSSDTVAVLREGQLLSGRYRIIEKIGTGGMGVVYKVEDEKLDKREFALKALPPDMATSKAAIKRLKKEALSAIELRHTNIMALHSFDNDGPHHYLVMELLDGPDLEEALADKDRFSLEEVLDVARQVCPALDHAHECGVIHRDIKPGNLLYKKQGEKQVVKIADFGIAFQVRDSIARITGQDTTGGTMHYMPPEQLAGRETDARSDQYALSASLYELLRGRTPFQGAGGVLMRQIEEKQAESIKDAPDHVNAALLKGLAKKPEDRFESCGQLLEVLEGRLEVAAAGKSEAKSAGGGSSFIIGFVGLLLVVALLGAEYSQGFFGLFKEEVKTPLPTEYATAVVPTKATAQVLPTVTVQPTQVTPPSQVPVTPKGPKIGDGAALPVTKIPTKPIAPVARKIEITFTSKPAGAKVYCFEAYPPFLDRTDRPFTKSFKPGKYRFKFAHVSGFREKIIPFEVKADGPKQLEVELEKQQGFLRLTVSPSSATVTVDGNLYRGGAMPLSPGPHSITASKRGYKAKSTRVTIEDGKTSTVNLALVVPSKAPKIGDEKTVGGITFCWCLPGQFTMGSPTSEAGREDDEGPQHKVQITKGFWLGKYEVTQSQWQSVMGSNPSKSRGGHLPVEQVSWNDCQSFIRKLKTKEGGRHKFRLPTEAEWEYACRAGTTSVFHFGDYISTDQVNYNGNYPYGTAPIGVFRGGSTSVGSFPSNAWGFHDMHGNVYEWCADWYSDSYYSSSPRKDPKGPRSGAKHIGRGGGWRDEARYCRSAERYGDPPEYSSGRLGFRLLLETGNSAMLKGRRIGEEKTIGGIRFCWCFPGAFNMGSPASEHGRETDEGPQHRVQITKGFWLSKYEVTQSQWQSVMGRNPSQFKGNNRPVEQVSWNDCQTFIRKLRNRLGGRYKFRLPTEAEWEYACRAGTTSVFNTGDNITTDQANYDGNKPYQNAPIGVFRGEPIAVGSLPSNAWGLHDMHGNVYEWCNDWYSDSYYRVSPLKDPFGPRSGVKHVGRGGGCWDHAKTCRSADRYADPPDYSCSRLGFRLLLEE